jgi:NAD(P)-dependent dehydrogenase (short-subunit alcohol dehydrogenase family)
LHRPEGGHHRGVDAVTHVGVGLPLEALRRASAPRVVDHRVDAAEALDRRGDSPTSLRLVAHIGRHEDRFRSKVGDLVNGPAPGLGVHLGDDDAATLTSDAPGDPRPDALSGAGDHGNVPLESSHHHASHPQRANTAARSSTGMARWNRGRLTASLYDAPMPVALVTGASRGIGKAAAIDLAAAGFDVAVSARTLVDGEGRVDADPDVALPGGLDTTVALVEEYDVAGLALRMDVLDRASVIAAADAALEHFGGIDVLVNNAIYQGEGSLSPLVDLDDEILAKLFEGNLFAHLALIRHVLPTMIAAGGGTIINIVSQAAFVSPPAKLGQGGWGLGYAMTKAAFARVTPLLQVEHGADGIRPFSVDPGLTITERMEAVGRAASYAAHFDAATPPVIGRAIRWLATDPEASALAGTVVAAQRLVRDRDLLPGWPA